MRNVKEAIADCGMKNGFQRSAKKDRKAALR
jgi:hypothetical protein